jgi:hypothetical protein
MPLHEYDQQQFPSYPVGHATVRDTIELTERELREERKKLRKKLARKTPVGFRSTDGQDA